MNAEGADSTAKLIAALVARMFGVSSTYGAAAIVWFPEVHWLPLGETLALAIAGPMIARGLNIPAGAFLVPMVVGIGLTHFGFMTIELPTWLLAGSYALVGWNVGLRFTRPLLVHAALALPRILVCTLLLIAICGGIAALFVLVANVDPLTAYLATSPGGLDSVAIIAATTHPSIAKFYTEGPIFIDTVGCSEAFLLAVAGLETLGTPCPLPEAKRKVTS